MIRRVPIVEPSKQNLTFAARIFSCGGGLVIDGDINIAVFHLRDVVIS